MKNSELIEILEGVAGKIGMVIRNETLAVGSPSGSGGVCKVRGEWWLLIDKKATPADRAAMLADALCAFDVSNIEMPKRVRDLIEKKREARAAMAVGAAPPSNDEAEPVTAESAVTSPI